MRHNEQRVLMVPQLVNKSPCKQIMPELEMEDIRLVSVRRKYVKDDMASVIQETERPRREQNWNVDEHTLRSFSEHESDYDDLEDEEQMKILEMESKLESEGQQQPTLVDLRKPKAQTIPQTPSNPPSQDGPNILTETNKDDPVITKAANPSTLNSKTDKASSNDFKAISYTARSKLSIDLSKLT